MHYDHTQKGWLHHLLYGVGATTAAGAWLERHDVVLLVALAGTALLMAVLAESFRYLRVRDDGDCLVVQYGPIPLVRKRIRHADITSVDHDRTTILDGWGVHWTPGRGWTYNISGFDCAKLTLGKSVVRVGTDDVDGLVEFLRRRIGRSD